MAEQYYAMSPPCSERYSMSIWTEDSVVHQRHGFLQCVNCHIYSRCSKHRSIPQMIGLGQCDANIGQSLANC